MSTQVIAIPRREARARAGSHPPGVAAWLPLASVLVGIVSLFYLAQTSELTTTGYSIQELQSEENDWRLQNEQLALEVARARSLSEIETQAVNRLKMVPPKEIVYLQPALSKMTTRASPSNRGETKSAPALERSISSSREVLDPVRSSLASLLPARPQQGQR